jgi:flagellar protein FlgJ
MTDGPSDAASRASKAREEKLNFAAPHIEKKTPRNAKVDEVSKMYEKQFLAEMLKAMRGTVSESALTKPSMAEKVYKDQMDERYVEQWGDSGGIGLSNLIYDQIMQKYFAEPQASPHGSGPNPRDAMMSLKSQGALQLSDRDVLKVSRMSAERPNQVPLKVELAPTQGTAAAPAHVRAPWSGTLLTQIRLPDGKTAVTLDHGVGLNSSLIFEGVPSALKLGQRIEKGATIGTLSPEIHSFFWNLNQKSSGPVKN